MAARAKRSARVAASSGDHASRCLLLALSHDELGMIVDGLADPLQPVVAVALSSTCLGLRTPLGAALEVLKVRHARAAALCRKVGWSCVQVELLSIWLSCSWLRGAEELQWSSKVGLRLVAADAAALGMILCTNGLPRLRVLHLNGSRFGDVGMHLLCDGLSHGEVRPLNTLVLGTCCLGLAGSEALAGALCSVAMPKLRGLHLHDNPFGNPGIAAMATPLRKLPSLQVLQLNGCGIGDEGVASLVANHGKDDFQELERLFLDDNQITDSGCAMLVRALKDCACPALFCLKLAGNPASEAAQRGVEDVLDGRMDDWYGYG